MEKVRNVLEKSILRLFNTVLDVVEFFQTKIGKVIFTVLITITLYNLIK